MSICDKPTVKVKVNGSLVRVRGRVIAFTLGYVVVVLFPVPPPSYGVAGQCSTSPVLQWRHSWFTLVGNQPLHNTLVITPPLHQMIPVHQYVSLYVSSSWSPVCELPPLRSSSASPWSADSRLLQRVCVCVWRTGFLYTCITSTVH